MDEASAAEYITQTFPGVETTTNFGYTLFFEGYDPSLPCIFTETSYYFGGNIYG